MTLEGKLKRFRDLEGLFDEILDPQKQEAPDLREARQDRALSLVSVLRKLFHEVVETKAPPSSLLVDSGALPKLFVAVTLRWPVLGGHEEGSWQGTTTVRPGETMSKLRARVVEYYTREARAPVPELVTVVDFSIAPEELSWLA